MSSATVPDLLGLPAKELFSITAIGYQSLILLRTLAFSRAGMLGLLSVLLDMKVKRILA